MMLRLETKRQACEKFPSLRRTRMLRKRKKHLTTNGGAIGMIAFSPLEPNNSSIASWQCEENWILLKSFLMLDKICRKKKFLQKQFSYRSRSDQCCQSATEWAFHRSEFSYMKWSSSCITPGARIRSSSDSEHVAALESRAELSWFPTKPSTGCYATPTRW